MADRNLSISGIYDRRLSDIDQDNQAFAEAVSIIRIQRKTASLTIPSGQTTSDVFDARGYAMFGLVMPAAFTGTSITFQVSADGTTFQALYDTANTQVSVNVSASRSYDLPAELAAWPYWKIVSGSAEAATRVLLVVAKG